MTETLTLPTKRGTETGTTYTITAGTVTHYTGGDPDDAIRVLTGLIEAEEDDVTVYAVTDGRSDPGAARAVLDEATVDASLWPTCGYPELLDPADMRDHVATCRVCGRDD